MNILKNKKAQIQVFLLILSTLGTFSLMEAVKGYRCNKNGNWSITKVGCWSTCPRGGVCNESDLANNWMCLKTQKVYPNSYVCRVACGLSKCVDSGKPRGLEF